MGCALELQNYSFWSARAHNYDFHRLVNKKDNDVAECVICGEPHKFEDCITLQKCSTDLRSLCIKLCFCTRKMHQTTSKEFINNDEQNKKIHQLQQTLERQQVTSDTNPTITDDSSGNNKMLIDSDNEDHQDTPSEPERKTTSEDKLPELDFECELASDTSRTFTSRKQRT